MLIFDTLCATGDGFGLCIVSQGEGVHEVFGVYDIRFGGTFFDDNIEISYTFVLLLLPLMRDRRSTVIMHRTTHNHFVGLTIWQDRRFPFPTCLFILTFPICSAALQSIMIQKAVLMLYRAELGRGRYLQCITLSVALLIRYQP